MLEATKNVNRATCDNSKKLKISKNKGLFGFRSTVEFDAIDFYKKKILTLKQKIRDEEKLQKSKNAGLCVIIFRSK